MTTLNNSQRVQWIKLWKSVLKAWHVDFFTISEIKFWKNEDNLVGFWDVDLTGEFFSNGIFKWTSSLYNAELVIKQGINYKNCYDLFYNQPFCGEFNLHKSVSSLCECNSDISVEEVSEFDITNSGFYKMNQTSNEYYNTLAISRWSYTFVIISAICFVLENIYKNYSLEIQNFKNTVSDNKRFKTITRDISIEVQVLLYNIGVYLLHENYSSELFTILNNTNIFRIEKIATVKAFISIFKNLEKKKYRYHIKHLNGNILHEFFKVFHIKFIFSDMFIENEIRDTLLNAKNRYYVENLIEMLNIYKSFFSVYFEFEPLQSPCSDESDSFAINDKLFINVFFRNYSNTISELDWESREFKNVFPSIQLNIRESFKNFRKVFKKLSIIGISLVPFFLFSTCANAMQKRSIPSFQPASGVFVPKPSGRNQHRTAVCQATEGRADMPRALQTPIQRMRAEQAKALHNRNQSSEQFQEALIVIPNSSQYYEVATDQKLICEVVASDPQQIGLLKNKQTQQYSMIGNVGSYEILGRREKIGIKRLNKAGLAVIPENCVKAHILPEKVRGVCGVTRADGWAIIVPKVINTIEESKENASSRQYMFTSKLLETPFENAMHERAHSSLDFVLSRAEVITDPREIIDPTRLDFMRNRWNQNINPAVRQATQESRMLLGGRENSEEAYSWFYGNHISQQIDDCGQQLHSFKLIAEGNGHTMVLPGIVVSETIEKVNELHRLGLVFTNYLTSQQAQETLNHRIEKSTREVFDQARIVASRNIFLSENTNDEIPPFLLAFKELPIQDNYSPSALEAKKTINQAEAMTLGQKIKGVSLDNLDDAMMRGRELGVGDFSTQPKSAILQTSQRPVDETFLNTRSIADPNDPSIWVD